VKNTDQTMDKNRVARKALTIPADAASCGELRDFVRAGALDAGLSEERTYDLLVAVNEAISNAIEHGSPLGPRNKIRVSWTQDSNHFEVRIKDEGVFKRTLAPSGDEEARGRGIFLMLALTDQVSFNETAKGTTVHLVIHHQSAGSAT